jgi:hypothetical protein
MSATERMSRFDYASLETKVVCHAAMSREKHHKLGYTRASSRVAGFRHISRYRAFSFTSPFSKKHLADSGRVVEYASLHDMADGGRYGHNV